MSKISFRNESRNIPGFPLNKIVTVGKFQDLDQESQFKQTRLDIIDQYFAQLPDIEKNKVKSTEKPSRKISEIEIRRIYSDITGKKAKSGQGKNELIDLIVDFYRRKYHKRHTINQAGINIQISDGNTSVASTGVSNIGRDFIDDSDSDSEGDF